mmetsp:Transcript_19234/g.55858  ORF Transcript_19234/g.55858 Transcript_19234/m.55858 type:complete len:294 (-) Transcript_19234:318-1199(-)
MRLKHLESALSSITREFPSPKVALEQYPTSAHLAASVIQLATENDDLGDDRICLDLGCGTGMLSVASAFVCPLVIAVDCDNDALAVAQENVEHVELEDTVVFVQAQVQTRQVKKKSKDSRGGGRNAKGRGGKGRGGGGRGGRGGGSSSSQQAATDTKAILILDGSDGIPLKDRCVDTVLTNPPFGTKHNAGIDVQFLRTACRLARRAVYSFHKRSTRAFLLKIAEEWGYQATVVAEMAFDIPQMYQFHNQKSKDVEVDLIRVDVCAFSSPTEDLPSPSVLTGDDDDNEAEDDE